jgi:hypothetical protein
MLTLVCSQLWLQQHVEEHPWLAHLQKHHGLPSASTASTQGASSADSPLSAASSDPTIAVDADADCHVDHAALTNVKGI